MCVRPRVAHSPSILNLPPPMLAIALLLPPPGSPIVPGAAPGPDAQWAAVAACPKVSVPGVAAGSGAVIGVKDGFAYVLTAAHVVPFDAVEVQFATRATHPKVAWAADRADVLARWPDPDLALIRLPLGDRPGVAPLPLAGPGRRPKAFPFPAWAVGVGDADAAAVRFDRVVGKRAVRPPERGLAFYWETARPPAAGRSGGPLLDGQGRVIGICAAARGDRGYYTHLDEILAALKEGGHGWLFDGG